MEISSSVRNVINVLIHGIYINKRQNATCNFGIAKLSMPTMNLNCWLLWSIYMTSSQNCKCECSLWLENTKKNSFNLTWYCYSLGPLKGQHTPKLYRTDKGKHHALDTSCYFTQEDKVEKQLISKTVMKLDRVSSLQSSKIKYLQAGPFSCFCTGVWYSCNSSTFVSCVMRKDSRIITMKHSWLNK